MTNEGEWFLNRIEKDRADAIEGAIRALEDLRVNGRRATIRIETTARGDYVMGEEGPVDVRGYGEGRRNFHFEVPEGPVKDSSA